MKAEFKDGAFRMREPEDYYFKLLACIYGLLLVIIVVVPATKGVLCCLCLSVCGLTLSSE